MKISYSAIRGTTKNGGHEYRKQAVSNGHEF